MSIKDTIVRKLALRWLRGKTEDLRGKERETGMGKVLKFLDGWKLVIGVLILFVVKVYDGMSNGHSGDMAGMVLALLGWMPQGVDVGQATGAAVILIGIGHKVWKAQQQALAGSSAAGLLSVEGYVSRAAESGIVE